MRDFRLSSGGRTTMGISHLFNPFKINVFKIHSLKIFNLAQQNLTKLLCRNCADIRKAYIGYVAIYAIFLFKTVVNEFKYIFKITFSFRIKFYIRSRIIYSSIINCAFLWHILNSITF